MARRSANTFALASDGLVEPFPASPMRLPRHGIYVHRLDDSNRAIYQNFYGDYAARHFLDLLIGNDSTRWGVDPLTKKPQLLIEDASIRIRCDTLEDLIEYEMTDAERSWSMPENVFNQAMLIRQARVVREDGDDDAAPEDVKPERVKKEPKPKIDRSAKVTIQAVADELKMDAKEARTILRKLKIEKPAGGWLFDPSEVDELKKKLAANRK